MPVDESRSFALSNRVSETGLPPSSARGRRPPPCRVRADLDMGLAEPPPSAAQQRRKMRGVGLVVGEAGEMDARERRQCLSRCQRADLVAPIGRERDAMGEEEDVPSAQPPRDQRARAGWRATAAAAARRRPCSRYLGSSGLTSRGCAPSAVRTRIDQAALVEAPDPLALPRAGADLRAAEIGARAAARDARGASPRNRRCRWRCRRAPRACRRPNRADRCP